MNKGVYIVGTLKGYSESEWGEENGKHGVNRRIGVTIREYQNDWGETEEVVQTIDVSEEKSRVVKEQVERMKGKLIQVAVVFKARVGGRNGAWLACFMPKESIILEVGQNQKKS